MCSISSDVLSMREKKRRKTETNLTCFLSLCSWMIFSVQMLYMYSYLLILNEKNKLKCGTCEIIVNIFISFAKELTLIMVAVTKRACY